MVADITDKFIKGITNTVFDLTPRFLDEIQMGMEHAENPINQTLQIISQFHGPYNGASSHIADFIKKYSDKLSKFENALGRVNNKLNKKIDRIQQAIGEIENRVETINKLVGNNMSTAHLRSFIQNAQNIHPLINDMIQREISKFPYFKQISEEVGMFFNLHIDKTLVNAEQILSGNRTREYSTNSNIKPRLYNNTFKPIADMVEDGMNLVDSFMHRALPLGDNIKNVAGDIAHGFNGVRDVLHHARALGAKNGSLIVLMDGVGEQLRLLNTFFPVTFTRNNDTTSGELTTEHGPLMVDEHGRHYGGNINDAPRDDLENLGSSRVKQNIKP
jgi:hypothetical protein